ncbi:LOW QUALITY PROTEIN: hypothetical protein PoB_007200500 [Plakobranchus ocellatus]|uniref:Uncharacterized protein n=1 Tax=Plakobranchus ocellatus TaxID=259542 RepID=A0AAV4DNK7_9GAST|nr:LOW QUALITY PROTEIN: hypothetical protein PoB_007200500 [Plakobranchus ocellatus]
MEEEREEEKEKEEEENEKEEEEENEDTLCFKFGNTVDVLKRVFPNMELNVKRMKFQKRPSGMSDDDIRRKFESQSRSTDLANMHLFVVAALLPLSLRTEPIQLHTYPTTSSPMTLATHSPSVTARDGQESGPIAAPVYQCTKGGDGKNKEENSSISSPMESRCM